MILANPNTHPLHQAPVSLLHRPRRFARRHHHPSVQPRHPSPTNPPSACKLRGSWRAWRRASRQIVGETGSDASGRGEGKGEEEEGVQREGEVAFSGRRVRRESDVEWSGVEWWLCLGRRLRDLLWVWEGETRILPALMRWLDVRLE
jgi:hypothetical protein